MSDIDTSLLLDQLAVLVYLGRVALIMLGCLCGFVGCIMVQLFLKSKDLI